MFHIKARLLMTLFTLMISSSSWSACNDYDAKNAADKVAEKFIKGKVFHQAEVLKVHRPSNRKEIASYIKTNNLYYTIFSLVNSQCKVQIIKRTHGKH
ncbi:hypothetical protein V6238_15170 [Marinomonas arenicola]|uniref:hypothetical protein n=1 Tax=Marinomonas arenicola TaxID=569601 RepID=UPI00311EE2FF